MTHRSDDAAHLLDQIDLDLGPGWERHVDHTALRPVVYFRHPEGHAIGLRLLFAGAVLQTWITAGPRDGAPEPDDPKEKAAFQAAEAARLQPGRSWCVPIAVRQVPDVSQAVADVVNGQLIPALTTKPRFAVRLATPTSEGEDL